MKRIVIFASGSGTNAENIIRHFKNHKSARVTLVLSNKENAGVFERCKNEQISCLYFKKADLTNSETILNLLKKEADFIVLAGFLLKVPENIIQAFPNKIINIHPALLPKFGGKGMYGKYVHEAVVKNKEPESGITIHYVNEEYDEGAIIYQAKCEVKPSDTPEDVAEKIHHLEMEHFPKVIESLLEK